MFAVLSRDNKSKPWELVTLSIQPLARTWQSALATQHQQRELFKEKGFEVRVCTAESWWADKISFLDCPAEGKEPLPDHLPPPKESISRREILPRKVDKPKSGEPKPTPKAPEDPIPKAPEEPAEKKSNVGKFL